MRIRRRIIHVCAGMLMAAFCTACVERGAARAQPVGPMPQPTMSSNRVELIIRNAKQEVINLRADLAAARIATVKKEIEVEELRRETAHARQRVSELQQAHDQQQYLVVKQQADLSGVNADRDRLQSEKTAMQRELAELPPLREALSASQAEEAQARARLKDLERAVVAFKEELETVKAAAVEREGRLSPHPVGRQTVRPPKVAASGPVNAADEPREGRPVVAADKSVSEAAAAAYFAGAVMSDPGWAIVAVKPGETLWDLAREHGVPIEQIKDANGLTRDLIKSGQRLRLPVRTQK